MHKSWTKIFDFRKIKSAGRAIVFAPSTMRAIAPKVTRFSPKNHLVLSNGLALYEHVHPFAVLIECEAVLK